MINPNEEIHTDKIEQKNREKFSSLRKLSLPVDQYAITGSGLLGIRNLRAIADIDILVSAELWDLLVAKYGMTDVKGVEKIVFPDGIVEAFREGSFYNEPRDNHAPRVADRIAKAEIIEGLPFDSIANLLYYKRREARDKDLRDISLLEEWLSRKT